MIKIKFQDSGSIKPFKTNWWASAKVEWAPVLLEENKPFWSAQTDTDGRPWAQLSPLTPDVDNIILHETGEMQNTAVVRPWGNKFMVDTTHYGAFQQFGTKRIPARPWMGVPQTAVERLPEIAWKHILK
jgi:phage gpG-like protein